MIDVFFSGEALHGYRQLTCRFIIIAAYQAPQTTEIALAAVLLEHRC
jgi:hypothetical protein